MTAEAIADPQLKQLISGYLADGPATAIELRRSFGATHEEVYAALVELEASGAAKVWTQYNPTKTSWRTAA